MAVKTIAATVIEDIVAANGRRPKDVILKGVVSGTMNGKDFNVRWRIDKTLLSKTEMSTIDCMAYYGYVANFVEKNKNATIQTERFGALMLTLLPK